MDPLFEPPDDFQTDLPTLSFPARRWYRVHRIQWEALYFDRQPTFRFNAPDGSFGVLYISDSYAGAFAETLLGGRSRPPTVTERMLRQRALTAFDWRALVLADFAEYGLPSLGLDGRIASGDCYALAQRWAAWVHGHPRRVDGICYFARNAPNERSVVLFEDRAGAPERTEVVEASLMPAHGVLSPLVKELVMRFRVAIMPD